MGAILDIFGAGKAKKAQQKAADQQIAASREATDKSLAMQQEQFDRVWGATQVGRDAGNAATSRLSQLSGLTPNVDAAGNPISTTDWLRSTPGYDVNFKEGQRAQNASLASRGGLLSGDAGRAAIQYGQDFGNRIFNQERNALQSIAGLGQNATAQGASAGAQQANAGQNALFQNAGNLSSSYQNKADATSGFWGTLSGTFGQNALSSLAGSFMKGGF